ncbi:MAG: hypothetical protein ABL973_02060 [Micropepsaceae bacterium]
MSTRVRLLPTLIGAAGVLLCLRIGAMASSPSPEQSDAPAQSDASGDPAGAATDPSLKENSGAVSDKPATDATGAQQQLAQADATPSEVTESVAQSKGEAEVLQKLGERRAALDTREKDLSLREQLLLAAEKQVDVRLTELKLLEQKLDAMMSKRNEQEETQLLALVKTYEAMKPEDAARIFNRLERTILVDVSSRMKPTKVGGILAAMEPARAQDLTVLLAKRLKISQLAAPQPTSMAPLPVAAPVPGPVTNSPGDGATTLPVDGSTSEPPASAAPNG